MESADKQNLVNAAKQHIKTNYKKNKHHVACALVAGGREYLALHLDTSGFDQCAEPIAIANALADKEKPQAIVAVKWNGNEGEEPEVVPPCGDCRQLMLEFCPNLKVFIENEGKINAVEAKELLPFPYQKKSS